MQSPEQIQTAEIYTHLDLLTQCPDPAMERVVKFIRKSVKAEITLINGESGTGKELVARAVHEVSRRREHPLIIANCGAIPENLVESQFFGHERGSFTGALSQHRGFFERAKGGVIFLDEIGEMPVHIQPRLLRVLQGQSFFRIGGTEEIVPNCKIIAATNCNLEEKIYKKEFREDLFYRLNQFPIVVPPLRDRPQDIMHLARLFAAKYSYPKVTIADECEFLLQTRSWKGNVRELENFIRRTLVMHEGDSTVLGSRDIESYLPPSAAQETSAAAREKADLPKEKESLPALGVESALQAHVPFFLELIKKEGGWVKFKENVFTAIYENCSRNHNGRMSDVALSDMLSISRTALNYLRNKSDR
jgi:transcriptional regulator with PAS, ATPase and Fis domain